MDVRRPVGELSLARRDGDTLVHHPDHGAERRDVRAARPHAGSAWSRVLCCPPRAASRLPQSVQRNGYCRSCDSPTTRKLAAAAAQMPSLAALDHDQPHDPATCPGARLLLPPGADPGARYPTGVHCPRCPHRQLPKQEPGEAVQSSHQWIFGWGLIGVLAVIVAVGCEQHVDGLGNNPPMTREVAHSGQVDLDVAAIVAGMTRAHGAQEVASLPKWWRDLLSQP